MIVRPDYSRVRIMKHAADATLFLASTRRNHAKPTGDGEHVFAGHEALFVSRDIHSSVNEKEIRKAKRKAAGKAANVQLKTSPRLAGRKDNG
jgi:hypothetical protein